MKDYNELKAQMMAQLRPSSNSKAVAKRLMAEAERGIPNFGKPSMMDYIRGVDDFGTNRVLL